MHKELLKKIDDNKIISFDIFDTLILRNVVNPSDVFDFIDSRYVDLHGVRHIENFKSQRILAESKTREYYAQMHNRDEITLDLIYEFLVKITNIDDKIAQTYKNIEIEAELDLCVKNDYMADIYDYCLKKGKEIIILSDMYLPQSVIEELLSRNGFLDYKKLYLSSTTQLTKHSGRAFNYMLDDLKCDKTKLLHIGDNYYTDYQNALKFGINAYFYEKCLDLFKKDIKDENIKPFLNACNEEDITTSAILGHFINKFYSNRNNSHKYEYMIGYKYIGATLCGFLEWIYQEAREKDIKKLLFGSREGYIMNKAFKILFSDIPSEYFYISRRILHIPSITEDLSVESKQANLVLDYLLSLKYDSLKDFFHLFELNPDSYKSQIIESGFKNSNSKVTLPDDKDKLKKLWKLIFEDTKNIAEKKRNVLLNYYKHLGLYDLDNVAFIDIGWSGRLQTSFEKILSGYQGKPNVFGYYMGLLPKASLYKNEVNLSGYYFDSDNSFAEKNILPGSITLLEFLFTAPHGSVIDIEEVDNTYKMLCDEDSQPDKIKVINAISEGVMDFVNDYSLLKSKYNLKINKEFSFYNLFKLITAPEYDEACYFGNLKHVDGSIKKNVYFANPFALAHKMLSKDNLLQEYHNSLWPYGYKVRILKSKFFTKTYKIKKIPTEEILQKQEQFFNSFCQKYANKRICCYGAGVYAHEVLKKYDLSKLNIECFIDRDINKKGTLIQNYTINHLDDLKTIKPDILLLTVIYTNELFQFIKKYIKENKLPTKIFHVDGISKQHSWVNDEEYVKLIINTKEAHNEHFSKNV